jgi:hypothetical protein
MRGRELCLLIATAALACASSLPIERRDYVLAHPHGWVEIAIDDRGVPLVPETENRDGKTVVMDWVKPEICYASVRVDGEDYVDSTQVFPQGDRAPFRADSGIRFPVLVGMPVLKLRWSGCRVKGEETESVEQEIFIAVERDLVTDVQFDGTQLSTAAPRADTVVSLDDVYEAITGKRKGQR